MMPPVAVVEFVVVFWLVGTPLILLVGWRINRLHEVEKARRVRDLAILATAEAAPLDWWPDDLSREEWAQ